MFDVDSSRPHDKIYYSAQKQPRCTAEAGGGGGEENFFKNRIILQEKQTKEFACDFFLSLD